MALIKDLLDKPHMLSTASKYTTMNSVVYLAAGALLLIWPGATQTILMEPAFIGREEGLIRVLGMTLAIIGWFYLFGGRSGARQFVAASVFDTRLRKILDAGNALGDVGDVLAWTKHGSSSVRKRPLFLILRGRGPDSVHP